MSLPLEFSFKVGENNERVFYATKHGMLEEYIVAWNSETMERICIEHYLVEDVERLVTDSKWILVEVYSEECAK